MEQFSQYAKSLDKDFIDVINNIIHNKQLIDIGYVVRTRGINKYDIRSFTVQNGEPVEYYNVELLYPSGITAAVANSICLVFKIYSPITSTVDENGVNPTIPPYSEATVKAIPLSNLTQNIVTPGISPSGNFNINSDGYTLSFMKDMLLIHSFLYNSTVTLSQTKKYGIAASIMPKGMDNSKYSLQFIMQDDGYAILEWDKDNACVYASVNQADGVSFKYYFNTNSAFIPAVVKTIDDILNTAGANWKRIEQHDAEGWFSASSGELFESTEKHLATYEDVHLLYMAIINHTHSVPYSWTGSSGSSTATAAKTNYATNEPKPVNGYWVAQENN